VSGIYLDHNASSPIDRRVWEAVTRCATSAYGNASSRDHVFGWNAAEQVEYARAQVASLVGASPHEIVFTSGATESVSLALRGVTEPREGAHLVLWSAEHESVLAAATLLERRARTCVTRLGASRDGRARSDDWSAALLCEPSATLAALMRANNETGVLQPTREVAAIARGAGASFFCDATQAVGRIPVDFGTEGVDLAAFSAHKMHGPMGVGALYVRGGVAGAALEPLVVGGGQEWGLRAGTLNVPAIVGFGEACRIASGELGGEMRRVGALRDALETAIHSALADVWVNGVGAERLPNTSNMGFAGIDARALIRDMHEVACTTRSACGSARSGPSHVLKAMGLSDDVAYSCVRFSLGRFTTEAEIGNAAERVVNSVRRLRRRHVGAVSFA
jgi:cysteine desulfurase